MRRFFKRSFAFVSNATTVFGWLPSTWQASVTGALSLASGYFTYRDQGIGIAIFCAAGVLAFGMAAIFFGLRISQMTGIFRRVSVGDLAVTDMSVTEDNRSIPHINMAAAIRNNSQRLVFYRLRRASHSIGRQISAHRSVDQSVGMIVAGGSEVMNFATIDNVPLPEQGGPGPTGNIELEIEYGKDADRLIYLLRWNSSISLGLKVMPTGEKLAHLGAELKQLEHSRI